MKPVPRKRSRERKAAAATSERLAEPGRPGDRLWWLGSIFVLLLGTAVVVYVFRPFSTGGATGLGEPAIGSEPWLSHTAFTAEAAVEDLRQEAFATAEDLLQAYPNQAAVIGVAARLRYTFGMEQEAHAMWETCVALDPQDHSACYGLGLVAVDRGEFLQAAEWFRRVTELNPDDPKGHYMLGNSLMMAGQPEQAIQVLETHARSTETTADVMVLWGLCCLHAEQYEKARRTFQLIIQQAPEERAAYYGLARVSLKLGDREKAAEYLKQFRALSDEDVQQWYKILPGTPDARRAAGMANDTNRLREILVYTLNDAGRACYRLEDNARAETMWRKASVLDPKDPESRHCLLSFYDQQQRFADALVVCRELCDNEPENADHWHNLGLLYARGEQVDQAREALRRAVELDPDNVRYQQAYGMTLK